MIRTIFALLLAVAIAALPLTGAAAGVAKIAAVTLTQSASMDDCHGSHQHHTDADKASGKTSCVIACGSICWTSPAVPAAQVLLGRVQGVVVPSISDDAAIPHVASPPFRPPRI